MQISFELQDAYRKNLFIASGKEVPSSVEPEAPLEEISPEARAVLARFGIGVSKVTLRLPSSKTWKAPFLPDTAEQWNALLLTYQADYEQAEAEAKAEHEKEVHQQQQKIYQHQLQELLWVTDVLRKCEQFCNEQKGASALDFFRFHHIESNFSQLPSHLPGYSEALELYERVKRLIAEHVAAERERVKQAEADKAAWIAGQGSEHLKDGFAAGYSCARVYLVERAQKEYPGYIVDLDDTARWTDVDCPSPEALAEAKRTSGTVVWLTNPVGHKSKGSDQDEDAWGEDDDDYFVPCEAVVIMEYLGCSGIKLVRTI